MCNWSLQIGDEEKMRYFAKSVNSWFWCCSDCGGNDHSLNQSRHDHHSDRYKVSKYSVFVFMVQQHNCFPYVLLYSSSYNITSVYNMCVRNVQPISFLFTYFWFLFLRLFQQFKICHSLWKNIIKLCFWIKVFF